MINKETLQENQKIELNTKPSSGNKELKSQKENQISLKGSENESLSNANFAKIPKKNSDKEKDKSQITNLNSGIYLETSINNPFINTINSRIIPNNKFQTFMNIKKKEKKNLFQNLIENNKENVIKFQEHEIFLHFLSPKNLEEQITSVKNGSLKGVKIQVHLNKNSLFAFNIKTNFDLPNADYFPLLSLNFDNLTCDLQINQGFLYTKICCLGSDKIFLMRFFDKNIFNFFASVLSKIVIDSVGYNNNLLYLSQRKNFFKLYSIKISAMLTEAKTGDIILFKGFHHSARCQRCFTRAEFDHAALLIKRHEYLELYESNSTKLVIDEKNPVKLNKIKNELSEKLEDFLNKTKNAKYRLPVSIVCCPGKKSNERFNNWDKSKGFFCSQLVAAAYLNMGIIYYEKATANYLPGKFAQDSVLPFNTGFNLGPEVIIDLSK